MGGLLSVGSTRYPLADGRGVAPVLGVAVFRAVRANKQSYQRESCFRRCIRRKGLLIVLA